MQWWSSGSSCPVILQQDPLPAAQAGHTALVKSSWYRPYWASCWFMSAIPLEFSKVLLMSFTSTDWCFKTGCCKKRPFVCESLKFTFVPYSDILSGICEFASFASFLQFAVHSDCKLITPTKTKQSFLFWEMERCLVCKWNMENKLRFSCALESIPLSENPFLLPIYFSLKKNSLPDLCSQFLTSFCLILICVCTCIFNAQR